MGGGGGGGDNRSTRAVDGLYVLGCSSNNYV